MEEARAFYENLRGTLPKPTKSTSVIAETYIEPKREEPIITKLGIDARERGKLAKILGVSDSHMKKRLYLLYLPEEIQTMLDNEKIHVREAYMLNQLRGIISIRKQALEKGLTKEQLQAKESEFWKEVHIKMLEAIEYVLRGEPDDRSKRHMKLPDLKIFSIS